MRIKRWCLGAFLGSILITSTAQAQFGEVLTRQVNIDYFLLGYFNRVMPLPKMVNGDYENHYSALNFIGPGFQFVNHDLDFLSSQSNSRSMGMGGAGVALAEGAGALAINPAGLARGLENQLYFSGGVRFGSGPVDLASDFSIPTGIVGDITVLSTTVEPRFQTMPVGLYAMGRPFRRGGEQSGVRGFLGNFSLAGGYRRFVEITNGTNFLTDFQPEGGIQGNTAAIKQAAQSREAGGVDAFVVSAATAFGGPDSPVSLSVGATANLVSGRTDAEQVFTVSQLTQIVVNLPGVFGQSSFLRQKFTAEAYDYGAQLNLLGGTLRLGGVFRPGFELRMRNGKYRVAELQIPQSTTSYSGSIADYDLNIPDQLRVGGALEMERLLGDGVDRGGILGYVHRFLGRGTLAVDVTRLELSTATVSQREDSLRNSQLEEDILWQNLALDYAEIYGAGFLRSTMPLYNGNAGLRDQNSYHVGFDTPLVDRADGGVSLRLGFGQVPIAFPSLVLGNERFNTTTGLFERPVLLNDDGTPQTEDVDGSLFSIGLGYQSGAVEFSVGLRSLSYDYVTWWGGRQPVSWYNPVTFEFDPDQGQVVPVYNPDGPYESIIPPELGGAGVGAKVKRTDNQLHLSASLSF